MKMNLVGYFKKKYNDPTSIFLFGWTIFLLSQFLTNSMFKYESYAIVFKIFLALSYLIIVLKVLLYDTKYYLNSFEITKDRSFKLVILNKEIFLKICTIMILSISGIFLFLLKQDSSIIKLVILLLGATNIEIKDIIRRYFWVILISMIAVVFLTQIGFLENLVYDRGDGTIRNSLGLLYPTNFSSRIFFLVLCYAYLKDFKLKAVELIVIGIISYLTLILTDGRLDVYSIVFILALVLIKKLPVVKQKIIALASILVIPLSILFTIASSVMYDPQNSISIFLNRLLSNRLRLGKEAFERYSPFTPFGQIVESNGWGGLEGKALNPAEYFYIDSSYLKILFMQGFITFIVVIALILYTQVKFVKMKKYNIVFVFAIMGIYAIVSEFLIKPEYFPFILSLYSLVNEEDTIPSME